MLIFSITAEIPALHPKISTKSAVSVSRLRPGRACSPGVNNCLMRGSEHRPGQDLPASPTKENPATGTFCRVRPPCSLAFTSAQISLTSGCRSLGAGKDVGVPPDQLLGNRQDHVAKVKLSLLLCYLAEKNYLQ